MTADYHVFSTLANSQVYNTWIKTGGPGPNVKDHQHSIEIAGGAGVINRKNLQTPRGVMTGITSDQYEILKTNHVFNLHVENGHLLVVKRAADPEVMAADMESRDESDQAVSEDFKEATLAKLQDKAAKAKG